MSDPFRQGAEWLLLAAAASGLAWAAAGFSAALCERIPSAAFLQADRDPSYERFLTGRYAYERYGYLFLPSGEDEKTGEEGAEDTPSADTPGTAPAPSGQELARYADYDVLMRTFYSVHPSTTAPRGLMRAADFFAADLTLAQDASVPQILIYHTHSQETYADYGPGHPEACVTAAGERLAELLRAKGWNVIHDTSAYDMQGGTLDRSRAYNYALEGVTRILEEHPTVEVVLDLHRDGVSETTRLVAQADGRPTAGIMFFQGMSRTPEGEIASLPNPYLKENLAFSFQMQYALKQRWPELPRKIYLKGFRYNLHLRPRSALIEVGAQTNTGEEALNAMEPLAEVLHRVLQGR